MLPNEPVTFSRWHFIKRLQQRTGRRCWCGILHPGIGHNRVLEGHWLVGQIDALYLQHANGERCDCPAPSVSQGAENE